jgi:hypothetical protein
MLVNVDEIIRYNIPETINKRVFDKEKERHMRNAKRWLAAMMSASMVLSSGGVATLASTMSAYAAEVETPDEVLDEELVEADEEFEEPDSEIVDEVADEIEADEEIVESEEAVEEEAEAEDDYEEEVVEEAEEEEFGLEAASADAVYASQEYTVDTANIKIADKVYDVDDYSAAAIKAEIGSISLTTGERLSDYGIDVDLPTTTGEAKVTFKFADGDTAHSADTLKGTVTFKIVDPKENADYVVKVGEDDLSNTIAYKGRAITADDIAKDAYLVKNGNEKITKFDVSLDKNDAQKVNDKVKVTFKVDGKAVVTKEVTIVPIDLRTAKITATIKDCVYNTKVQEPKVSDVKADGVSLTAKDYDVVYGQEINATDAAVVTISGKGDNVIGDGKATFAIKPYVLSDKDALAVESKGEPFIYNGAVQVPADGSVTVKAYIGDSVLDNIELPTADYKVVPVTKDSKNVGKYKVTIEARNKNLDTTNAAQKEAYEIVQASMNSEKVKLTKKSDVDVLVGTSTKEVEDNFAKYFELKLGNYALTADDFTVSVKGDLSDVGNKGTVTVTGKGNFKDSKSLEFEVAGDAMASEYTSEYTVTYNGKEQKPTSSSLGTLKGKDANGNEVTLTPDKYSVTGYENVINVSKDAIAFIEGRGTLEGKKAQVKFEITAKSIAGAAATVSGIGEGSYLAGTEITGAKVTLKEGSVELEVDKDCKVTAKTVKDGYLSAVTITGQGNYTGETEAAVDPAVAAGLVSLEGEDVEVKGKIPTGLSAYTGETIGKYVDVVIDGKKVDPQNYAIKVTSTIDASTVVAGTEIPVKITPVAESLHGTKKASLKAIARNIADFEADVVVTPKSTVYTGEAIDADVKVGSLKKDTDFTVDVKDNVNAGEATVTIKGKGIYTGEIKKTFTIAPFDLSGKIKVVEPTEDLREFAVGKAEDLSKKFEISIDGTTKPALSSEDYTISMDPAGQEVEETDKALEKEITYKLVLTNTTKNFKLAEPMKLSYKLVKKTVRDGKIIATKNDFAFGDAVSVKELGTVTVTDSKGTKYKPADYDLAIEKKAKGATSFTDISEGETVTNVEDKYNVVATFKGNYVGTARLVLGIAGDSQKFNIDHVKLVVPTASKLVYTGKPINVTANYIGPKDDVKEGTEFVVRYYQGSKELKADEVIAAGVYEAQAYATENYGKAAGEERVTFEIAKKPVKKAEMEADLASFEVDPVEVWYAGQKARVSDLPEELRENYQLENGGKVEWDGKAETGKVNVKVNPDGNLTSNDFVEKEFNFVRSLSDDEVEAALSIPAQEYTGKAINPSASDVVIKEGSGIDPSWISIKNYGGDLVNVSKKAAYAMVVVTVPKDNKKFAENNYTFEVYFDIVSSKIDAVADELKALTDSSSVEDCQKAIDDYNALTPEQKAKVDADAAAKAGLEKANEKVKSEESEKAAQKEADPVAKQLKAVTDKTSAADAQKAVDAYNALSAAAKAKVDADSAAKAGLAKAQKIVKAAADQKAKDAEAKKNAAAANPVINQLKKITDNSSLSDAQAALAAYNKLTDAQKALVNKNAAAKAGLAKAKKIVDEAGKISAPAKVKIKKAKAGKKKIKVTWTKQKDADGFEIQVATNKKFTKNLKVVTVKKGTAGSKTIKKLKKGKKYYVRVRAFKNVKNGKVYGKFSKKKRSKKVK